MKNKLKVDYTLYLVTDRDLLRGKSLEEMIEQAILGGVTLVQLREKNASTLEFYNIAVRVKEVTDRYNIPLIVNDRLDIAMSVEAAGLHVGQGDLPARIARGLLGKDKILGVSAATLQEALRAQEDGADYVGIGAVFATDTKQDARHVSVEQLKEIRGKLHIPAVAIGGINENNIELLSGTGIEGVAVVSAIVGKNDARKAAANLKQRLKSIFTNIL